MLFRSTVGGTTGGDTTGNLGGLFGDWYTSGADSGVVGPPGNESVVGLGGATYPINNDGYGSYGGG